MVVLMIVVYYSKRTHGRVTKGRRHINYSLDESRHRLLQFSLGKWYEAAQNTPFPPAVKSSNARAVFLPRETHPRLLRPGPLLEMGHLVSQPL